MPRMILSLAPASALLSGSVGRASRAPCRDVASYGVVDEIARRVWLSGGRVLAVRRDDVPGRSSVAAILRYPL